MSRFATDIGHPGGVFHVMKIPVETLSEATLAGIIETFVLREGTDYGHADHDLAGKCRAVRRQLAAGVAEIDFDPDTETVDIRPVVR